MDRVDTLLNPQRQIFSVVGNIAKNPSLFLKDDNKITGNDFVTDFHKMLFNAMRNIIIGNTSVDDITPVTIDNFLKPYPRYYDIWTQNDGITYLEDARDYAQESMYDHDYDIVKKYSLLRQYKDNGVDVRDIYNYDGDANEITNSASKIDEMSINDILEHYTSKVIDIRNDVNADGGEIVKFSISDDIDDLFTKLSESPDMGFPFVNAYYNGLFKGMRPGKYLLRSGDTGTGKTRQDIIDMCNVACDEKYEIGRGWVRQSANYDILFISTELNKQELQVLTLAYLTGMTSSEIESGEYTEEGRQRLQHGVEVIKRSRMHFVYVSDFSMNDIQLLIEEHVMKYDVQYVVFDYIQNSPKLSRTIKESYGGRDIREDEIVQTFSRKLKELAEKYQLFIISSTQLNGKAKDESVFVSKDANVLRGGRATADKIDYGVLTFRATPADWKQLEGAMASVPGFGDKRPNFAHWVYKNRAGLDHVVVWTQMDLGSMREVPLFVTDYNYEITHDVPMVYGEIVDEEDVKESEEEDDF